MKGSKLCSLRDPYRSASIHEVHSGILAAHFGTQECREILSKAWRSGLVKRPSQDKLEIVRNWLEPKGKPHEMSRNPPLQGLLFQGVCKVDKGKQGRKADILSKGQTSLSRMKNQSWNPKVLSELCEGSSNSPKFWLTMKELCEGVEGEPSVVINATSRRHLLLSVMKNKMWSCGLLKESHADNSDFMKCWLVLKENPPEGNRCSLQQISLLHGSKICVPQSSCRGLLAHKFHSGIPTRKFEVQQTYEVLQAHLYWAKVLGRIQDELQLGAVCSRAKRTLYRIINCNWEFLWTPSGCHAPKGSICDEQWKVKATKEYHNLNNITRGTTPQQGNCEIIKRRWNDLLKEGSEANREGIGVVILQKQESITCLKEGSRGARMEWGYYLKQQPKLLPSTHEGLRRCQEKGILRNAESQPKGDWSIKLVPTGVTTELCTFDDKHKMKPWVRNPPNSVPRERPKYIAKVKLEGINKLRGQARGKTKRRMHWSFISTGT